MADPKQQSVEASSLFLNRFVPIWQQPGWMEADRWRRVVENQPIAAICEATLISDLQGTAWEVRAKNPREEDKLAGDIEGYTEVLNPEMPGGIGGFDNILAAMGGQDMLRLPIGGNFEVVRWPIGSGPYSRPHKKGHVYKIVYMDGATLTPTYDPNIPLLQRPPENAVNAIYFERDQIMRLILQPRTEMRRWGYGMAPPERIYLAILSLYRGDAYYANLLLDTPEAGILDLGDMSQESAENWVQSFRPLFTGIDPMKIGVLYEHDKPAQYINFGKPPTELLFDKISIKYAQVTHAGYGLTLTDTGLGDPQKTLAGSIRDERRSRRSGFGMVKEKYKRAIDTEILPDYLEFHWIENDEESRVQKGRAFLVETQALKAAKDAGFINALEGQQQLLKDGFFDIELEKPKEPEPVALVPGQPIQPAGEPAQQVADKVPASEGGRGDITGQAQQKAEVEKADHKYASTQFDMPDSVVKLVIELGKLIDPGDLYGDGIESAPHVTVKYGLISDDPAPIQNVVWDFVPFFIVTGRTSLFENDEFDVLKIEIISDELHRLNEAIAGLGAVSTHPGYNPHLTIAYLKKGTGKKYLSLSLPTQSILVSVLSFSKKDGSVIKLPLGQLTTRAESTAASSPAVQLSGVFRRAFGVMAGKMDRPRLTKLIKAATRKLFPNVAQSFAGLTDEELPAWQEERQSVWFGGTEDAEAVKAGGDILDELDDLLNGDGWWKLDPEISQAISEILGSSFSIGAAEAAQAVQDLLYTEGLAASPTLVNFNFELKNPVTLARIDRDAAQLVRRVDDGTRFYLKRILASGVDEGLSSPDIAAKIREGAGVDEILRQAGYNQRVIETVKAEVAGLSEYRANSITNTEINRAESQGRLDQWREMGLTRKAWKHTGRDVACSVCRGNEALGLVEMDYVYDDVFGGTETPPGHPGTCHCSLEFSEEELISRAGELKVWSGD